MRWRRRAQRLAVIRAFRETEENPYCEHCYHASADNRLGLSRSAGHKVAGRGEEEQKESNGPLNGESMSIQDMLEAVLCRIAVA